MNSVLSACPVCGCELSVEAARYRCWCCNRSFSYSEVSVLRHQPDHTDNARSDDELRQAAGVSLSAST